MNIAIIGYGKMGKEIERLAAAKGMKVVSIIDREGSGAPYSEINAESMKGVDVCIDFTHPDSALGNIRKIASHSKNMVIGTTGWYGDIHKAEEAVNKSNVGMIWSGNFSIGVNMFFRIIENAAGMMDNFDAYDAFVHEFHHSQKADSPSGTAAMIGRILLDGIQRKKKAVHGDLNRRISPDELHISSTRAGSIPGTHIVGFDSPADSIELKHTAKGREGFALGALMAAEWISGKKDCL